MTAARRFRLRPRYRGVAALAIGTGGAIAGAWLALVQVSLSVPVITGLIGMALGGLYFASPTWRLAITVDDDGYAVFSGEHERFRVPWRDVVRVIASPSTHTALVDAGDPRRNLLVPGDGAPAPYWIENAVALYEFILASVDADKVKTVNTLEAARPGK